MVASNITAKAGSLQMREFSIPSDFRKGTIDRYKELNERYDSSAIVETYGQATVGAMPGSGRNSRIIPTVTLDTVADYVDYSASRGVDFNYTLNASCMGNVEFSEAGMSRINRFLGRLWNIGIRNLTITLPQLMAIVRDSGYGFTIKASTICQIDSVRKAEFYKSQGVERIVIDEDITRDFRRIGLIREAFGDGVEMIVNSICMKDCPYKMFHYNHESHFSFGMQDVQKFFTQRCSVQESSDFSAIMHVNWVRPEDLPLYESIGVHRFKIQGRHSVLHGDPVAAAEAYMRSSYSGNLYDLLHLFNPRRKSDPYYPNLSNDRLAGFLSPFLNDPSHCSGNCANCGYCDAFASRAMDVAESEERLEKARASLAEMEPFGIYEKRSKVARATERLIRKTRCALTRRR